MTYELNQQRNEQKFQRKAILQYRYHNRKEVFSSLSSPTFKKLGITSTSLVGSNPDGVSSHVNT